MKSLMPNYKVICLWLALFMVLYLLMASYLSSKSETYLDLLEVQSQLVFGQKDINSKDLSFTLDEYGEAAIFFQAPPFNAADYDSLELQVEGLSINYQVNLVWINLNNEVPFEQKLLQPNSNKQINLIKNHPDWNQQIEQIGIRIYPQDHLGLTLKDDSIIKIKKLKLSSVTFLDSLRLIKDYWFDYDAWSYKSINHNRINPLLPIYCQPLVFILIWLLLGGIIQFVLWKNKLNLVLVIGSWLFLDVLFLYDMKQRTAWVQQYYSETEDNILPDENLNKLVGQVKSLLNLDHQKSKKKDIKVLILSTNRYQRARLIYHMLPVNSSFLDLKAESARKSKVNKGDYILSYDATLNPISPVSGKLLFNENRLDVKVISSDSEYILMKVLND